MNNLSKKRKREEKQITITIGKSSKGHYYISDSLGESNKIKIPITSLSKEDNESHSRDNHDHDANNSSPQQIIPEEIPQLAKTNEQNKTQPFYLPICVSWFNFDSVNEIESKSLPEFFCGKYPSKTPEMYKEFRNYIINLFRENPNAYLTATTCRKHLSGDAGCIIRLHAFLEHWGLINFNVDPEMKSTHPFLSKTLNFKAPIYIDASSLNKKIGSNQVNVLKQTSSTTVSVIPGQVPLTSQAQTPTEANKIKPTPKEEVKGLFPLNEHSDTLYRDILNQYPVLTFNQINFFDYNSRPKCDMCHNPCDIHWYINSKEDETHNNKNPQENSKGNETKVVILCDSCYDKEEYPEGTQKKDYDISNVFNLMMQNYKNSKIKVKIEADKWSNEESKQLIEAINNYGDGSWEDIIKVFNGKRTKADCIIHLMQMKFSLNENMAQSGNSIVQSKEEGTGQIMNEEKKRDIAHDNNNNHQKEEEERVDEPKKEEKQENEKNQTKPLPELNHVLFFAKMFEKYVTNDKDNNTNNTSSHSNDLSSSEYMKEVIYKTYAKSINVSHSLKNEEKEEMKRIMNSLIYFQMKKLELKLNYISEFEKIIHFETMQLKSVESQIMQDRIKLALKKNDLIRYGMKFRDAQKALREEHANKSNSSSELLKVNTDNKNLNQETSVIDSATKAIGITKSINYNAIANPISISNNNMNDDININTNTNINNQDIKPINFNEFNDIAISIKTVNASKDQRIDIVGDNNSSMNIIQVNEAENKANRINTSNDLIDNNIPKMDEEKEKEMNKQIN